jgi:crotonobetainyl-CoA:carnitine CoA-transferase CaiB-like acyl-CoA transferase
LEGLRVVDLTQGYVGYAGMLMADSGAEVIKVEPPEGDYLRRLGAENHFVNGTAADFLAVNRSKKSVTLDWQHDPIARAALDRMIALADVLISDLQPSAATAVGMTEEALRSKFPRLVFTSLTPYGDTGPIADQPATELEVQAMSGQWRYLGDYGAAPVRHGLPIGAVNSSVFAFQGTLGALHDRTMTGKGQKVECSQLGAELTMQSILWAAESEPDDWEGHTTAIKRPPARGYATKTQSILWGFMENQEGMSEFCRRLGLSDEFAHKDAWQVDAARPIFEEKFKDIDADTLVAWVRELRGNAVHYHTFESFSKDPQVEALGLIKEYEYPGHGKIASVGLAWEFSASLTELGRPPLLGEHTGEVLSGLGLPADQVAALTK